MTIITLLDDFPVKKYLSFGFYPKFLVTPIPKLSLSCLNSVSCGQGAGGGGGRVGVFFNSIALILESLKLPRRLNDRVLLQWSNLFQYCLSPKYIETV